MASPRHSVFVHVFAGFGLAIVATFLLMAAMVAIPFLILRSRMRRAAVPRYA